MTTPKAIKDKVKSKVHSQESIPSFIRKTYDILEERKFPDVIDWNPEGTALVIKKPSEFCQKVLPTYFKHNNLTSFVRQLNMYNFHKRRTQNIDHVYYHELFQKGKKSLLREIKRKNHEHTSEKVQKALEPVEAVPSGKDLNSIMYENQVLRRLYNEATSRLAVLENQVKDLSSQNQSLWTQLYQTSDRDTLKPILLNRAEKQASLTLDQLPMTFGDIAIPPLKLSSERQASIKASAAFTKPKSTAGFLNLSEASADTAEGSHNSPSLTTNNNESEKIEAVEQTSLLQLPQKQMPYISQLQLRPNRSDLFISKGDMSVGQLFEAWNQETQQNTAAELFCFADQKHDNNTAINIQALFREPALVGKRFVDMEQQANGAVDPRFNVPEPVMKRNAQDLCIFNRRSIISTGTEEKEILRSFLRRESSMGDDFDANTGIDLMDFNQPFLSFTTTKASS